jgi:hypothetical protein
MTVQELIVAIRARLPEAATVSCNLRDGLWRAAAVATPNINLERKGSTEEEAYTRLLDSVMQVQATQHRGSWRCHG